MVEVGQKVTAAVPVLASSDSTKIEKRLMRGTVVFVHREGRFHTVEVEYGKEKLKFTVYGV